MPKRRERSIAKEKYWRGIIEGWKSSGKTIASYCRQSDLKAVMFHYWRREIRKRDQESVHQPSESAGEMIRVPFTEVRVPTHASPGIEVIIAGDRRIIVHPGFDAESFMRVVHILEQVSC